MTEQEKERRSDDVALARYSVIAPLVGRQMTEPEKKAVRSEILAAKHVFPDGVRKVSRRSLDRWLSWYHDGHIDSADEIATEPGIEALRPLPREDKGVPRVLDDAVVERAVFLRREEPSRSTAAIIDLLKAEAESEGRAAPLIREATLAYHLRKRKATKRDLKREGKAYRRYQQPRRNATWQGDWTQGFPIADPSSPQKPRLCHLHAFIDDRTRYIVHAEFYFRQNLPCLEDCFRKAILHGGIPERVYWDNGSVYRSRQIQMVAARLESQVIFATPYAPEGKGKIERWFRTVKDSFYPEARGAGIESLAQLNEFFWGWLQRVYHAHEHSEIQMAPKAAWEAGAKHVRFPQPSSLTDLFLWEEKRRVDKSGCIHLCGNAYPVPEHLVGRQVEVRFDPFDLSRARLYERGVFIEVLEPQTLVSQTFRKAKPRKKDADAPRASSVAYRQKLSGDLRAQAQTTLENVRGERQPFLSVAQFLALLQTYLPGRILTPTETRQLESFFAKNAPLDERQVQSALLQAVESKGTQRHLRFYLGAIQAEGSAQQ